MSEPIKSGPIDGMFLFLADKFNGKKTTTGILMIIGGVATLIFTPDYKDAGFSLIGSGIPMLLVGLTHKAIKKAENA